MTFCRNVLDSRVMKQSPTTLFLAGILSVLALSCGGGESESTPESSSQPAEANEALETNQAAQAPAAPEVSAEAAKAAAEKFVLCAACHGEDGKAETPTALALVPRPRAFSDSEWQTSVTNGYLADIIVKGGASVGKSPLMAPNPDLADKPEVVNGLVAMIRAFAE